MHGRGEHGEFLDKRKLSAFSFGGGEYRLCGGLGHAKRDSESGFASYYIQPDPNANVRHDTHAERHGEFEFADYLWPGAERQLHAIEQCDHVREHGGVRSCGDTIG